jgi:UDP-glucose:(heptosyl)LPS alpha-1,3-glucosyltransferase
MRLACLLFRYFPFGGMERNCRAIAEILAGRGHEVDIVTSTWRAGELPDRVDVIELPTTGLTNHGRDRAFIRAWQAHAGARRYDRIVGFNKMPGLDVYFAADACYAARIRRERRPWYRLTPRYRTRAALERAVFAPGHDTRIILIAASERADYVAEYGTPEERFSLIPPAIAPRFRPPTDRREARAALRAELGVPEDTRLLLMVASNLQTKGFDRVLRALATLPADLRGQCRLVAIGGMPDAGDKKLMHRLGVADMVLAPGSRGDTLPFYAGSDLFIHPARIETGGNALLEALASGLPVLASGVCGHGVHVTRAGAGVLLDEPFEQKQLDTLLQHWLTDADLAAMGRAGAVYAACTDLYSGRERAADIIEST